MARPAALQPENQFPVDALAESVQVSPPASAYPMPGASGIATWVIASSADLVLPWGRNVMMRDRQLREFWPSESFLAGAVTSISFRNAAFDWKIDGSTNNVEQAVTDMLNSAIAGDTVGWAPFIERFSEDLSTQDNGSFMELIRDQGMDANSRFKGPLAPVIGLNHLDAAQCIRTGDPKYPVVYTDRNAKMHKLAWWEVIPFSNYPSTIERMNGVGYCNVTLALRLAQVLRSIMLYKDEKVGGRYYKQMHFVSGVSRQDISDAEKRGQEDADNQGSVKYIQPVILASLDPEKPVSTATIDLASLPDGFDYDQEMRWYITGLALDFGVDYQDFAPLASGNLGSSSQSSTLDRKSSGKGPAVFMRKISNAFKTYGVLPRGCDLVFEYKNTQDELEKQEIRTKAMEEIALSLRNGVLTPQAARDDLVRRGIYTRETVAGIAEDYGKDILLRGKGNVGQIGGNTMTEDTSRQDTGAQSGTVGDLLRKVFRR